jgi:hypothetical protein
LTGSINVDEAMHDAHPQASRWDYGVGINKNNERVVWVEVHPASSSHVRDMINKVRWLRGWLNSEAPLLDALPRHFVWVASGKVSLPPTGPQLRQLAAAGIAPPRERVTVDQLS